MTAQADTRIEDIITEEEAVAVGKLQDLHEIQVVRATHGLAETLALDSEMTQQLVGAMTMNLAGVNFEERRDVADELEQVALRLERITDLLGASTSAEVAVIALVSNETADESDGETPADPEEVGDDKAETRHARGTKKETAKRSKRPPVIQQQWFSVVYDPAMAAKVSTATPGELEGILEGLGERYVNLRLQRMGPEIKTLRIRQVRQHILEGRTIADLAVEANMKEPSLKQALLNVAATLNRRVDPKELADVLPDFDSRPKQLPKPQSRWLKSLLDNPQSVDEINQMTAAQQAHLAERLGHYLNPLLLRQWGHVSTQTRVNQMKMFLQGMSAKEIAESLGSEVSADEVSQNIRHARTRLKDRVAPELLLKLVAEAREYKPTQD